MKQSKKSRHSNKNKLSKTKKNLKNKSRCKYGCRTKDCGHTPFLYGGGFQKLDDLGQDLAYTGKPVQAVSPNPHFAYVAKGGKVDLGRAYPIVNNQYVPGNPTDNWLNSNSMSGGRRKRRGGKGCSTNAYGNLAYVPGQFPMKAGSCGCANNPISSVMNGVMKGGMCSMCSSKSGVQSGVQSGGIGFYKNPLPYPNGLVGTAWTPKISSWPGVDGVSGNSNYYPLNRYAPVDISREMIDVGAAKPFISGGSRKKKNKTRKHRGGNLSNSFGQDLINLGRSSFYNANSAFNALKGVPAPTNPLPWKDQLVNK